MFRLIRDAEGSDALTCLHSLGIARHRRKDYAEADFVVVAPSGIYCLEVKGGQVERKKGVWQIGWSGKSYTSSEGPFKQAQGARWALLDYLDHRLNRNLRRETLVGWGVIFPDVVFEQVDPEWDSNVVYDQRDKGTSFVAYIDRLAEYFRTRARETGRNPQRSLSATRREDVVQALRGDFDFSCSMRGLLIESERELVSLSADQHRILDFALNDQNPRILCDGPAGTGKTLIALEAAKRLSARGYSVLFLCYNNNLGRFLKLDVAEAGSRIHVSTVYSFLGEIIRRGGFGDALRSARGLDDEQHYFDSVYPDLFESACSALLDENALPQFDAVIIDEAQDVLSAPIMNCVDLVLADGFAAGRWLILHDSGVQSAIYDRVDQAVLQRLVSFGAASFRLNENFRNPKAIAQEACLMSSAPAPICRRTLVSPVDYRPVADSRDQAKVLRALLLELLRDGISPGSISILSPLKPVDACIGHFPPDIGKPFHVVDDGLKIGSEDAFTVSSIAGFKGLENDIIILTDLPEDAHNDHERGAIYVGMTRARTKLFALVGQRYLQARSKR